MDIKSIMEITGSIIVSFGGSAAILIGCTKWCSEIISNKLFEDIKKQNEKELEIFRTETLKQRKENEALVDKNLFITKSQYDMEIKIYKEIWESLYKCVSSIQLLFYYDEELPENEEIYFEHIKSKIEIVNKNIVDFCRVVDENAPFYVVEYYNSFLDLREEFRRSLELSSKLFKEAPKFSDELKRSSDTVMGEIIRLKQEILTNIRNYLQGLKIR